MLGRQIRDARIAVWPARKRSSLPAIDTAAASARHCPTCLGPDAHDEWNAGARGETPLQRVDRAYGEILQEVRVAQTGVQILFAFLLALAFTARFAVVTIFQRDLYVLALMLCVGSAALLIAPAAYHRLVYRRRLKQHLVRVANRLALSGLTMLLFAISSALVLVLDVILGLVPALVLGTGTVAWFAAWWFVLPAWSRLRHTRLHNAPDVRVPAGAFAWPDTPGVIRHRPPAASPDAEPDVTGIERVDNAGDS